MLSINRTWSSQSKTPLLRTSSSVSATARPQASAMGPSQTFESSQYKQKAQKLLKLVNDLRDLGARCCNVDLPTLVVCGNQSAGKSSVMERLSGVQLPRDKGTCTKAPMEVRQSTLGKNWGCTIKLRKEFDERSQQLPAPTEEHFCKVPATHKDKLHLFISAAQKALLNPDKDCKAFAAAAAAQAAGMANDADSTDSVQAGNTASSEQSDGDGILTQGDIAVALDESTDSTSSSGSARAEDTAAAVYTSSDALKFTKNIVVLDIIGADADLVLIDLPGIIQSDISSDSNVDLLPPAPSADPITGLLSLLSAMTEKLAQAIDAKGTDMAFFNTINQHFFEMAASIDKCRPAAWLKAAAPPATSAESAAPASDPNQPGYWLRPPDDSSGDLITLDKVQHLSDTYKGEQLPTFAPYKVLDVLVQGSKGRWEPAISSCLEAVAQQLEMLTAELVRDGFQRFPHAESWVWSLLCDKHSTSLETTQKQSSNLLEMEQTTTMTLNTLSFEQTKQSIVKMLTEHVCKDDAQALNDGNKQSLLQTLLDTAGIDTNAAGLHKMQAENLLERKGRSMDLLNLIAGALTYYQLSSSRMKDNVAYCIKTTC